MSESKRGPRLTCYRSSGEYLRKLIYQGILAPVRPRTMPTLPCCDRCKFYAHSPYMICAVNSKGIAGGECPDFNPNPGPVSNDNDPLSWYNDAWEPVGASYYGDQLIVVPVQQLALEQRITLLNWHPIFTGRCPNCKHPIRQSEPARVHWDCDLCGWKDDAV